MMNCPRCDTHIDEHPASTCLNQWIATDVMGWKKTERRPAVQLNWAAYSQEWYLTLSGHLINSTNVLDFSGKIAVAWEVVEKVGIHTIRCIVNPDKDDADSWWQAEAFLDPMTWGMAPTVPHAICRTAIKARCSKEHTQHKPECWKNQALSGLGVGGRLASCTCGRDKIFRTETT